MRPLLGCQNHNSLLYGTCQTSLGLPCTCINKLMRSPDHLDGCSKIDEWKYNAGGVEIDDNSV